MTVFLPLEEDVSTPATPPFLVDAADRNAGLAKVVQAILKAKRIVVICGAGISVQAGIPDFRSSDGLFRTLKRDNPRESLSSGKDLFDASVFNSEHTTSLFCQMMAQLSDMSQNADPTPFHRLLRALDDRGRLLRVYTQNIDAIEQKSGLSFGVPDIGNKKSRSRKTKHDEDNDTSSSRLPTPTPTPRCIPLHGTLQTLHCQICSHTFPLQDYLPSLNAGQPPQCPECTNLEETRAAVGKRPRGIGRLRPSVVLYNEAHKDSEGVGNVVEKDLIGSSKGKGRSGADFLLVVGTSLRIPGTKRMVREFSKAVRSRGTLAPSIKEESSSGSATPNDDSMRRSPAGTDEDASPAPVKAVYLNLDFPGATREWEGVFDAWVQGDAQTFADMVKEEIMKEAKAKEEKEERKRRKEEEAAAAQAEIEQMDVDVEGDDTSTSTSTVFQLPTPRPTPNKKRGVGASVASVTPSKRHKVASSSGKNTSKPKSKVTITVPPLRAGPSPSGAAADRRRDQQKGKAPERTHGEYALASPPHTPPRRTTSPTSCSQELYRTSPSRSTPESPSLAYARQRDRSYSNRPQLTSLHGQWASPYHYRFNAGVMDYILTSSIRSTLEDHEREREWGPAMSGSLVEVGNGQWGYRQG